MNARVGAVLFDLDGTLIDTNYLTPWRGWPPCSARSEPEGA